MGTMMLFIALGTTMLATRKINWYRVAPLTAEEGQ
jgi:inner membrane protein involved in colicin E2 resistance